MQRQDFYFELPNPLIARYPLPGRVDSRLLCLDGPTRHITHRQFTDLPGLLLPGDLLVLNNTKVMPARLTGQKSTGGAIELLVEKILSPQRALVQCRASKRPKVGGRLCITADVVATVVGVQSDLLEIEFTGELSVVEILYRHGQIPLPRYMARPAEALDQERYQTVYADLLGSVAAPTAGLHFDQPLLMHLQQQGIKIAYVTLHVGAGTFQPVRVDDLSKHTLHAEYAELSAATCQEIIRTQQQGGRIVAVGTTTVRTLETAALSGTLQPFAGETRLFIKPGFRFHCVDAMITNFHLPESTLLMLVCAFAGYKAVMHAYAEAVTQQYRFYSYGDAMWATRHLQTDA